MPVPILSRSIRVDFAHRQPLVELFTDKSAQIASDLERAFFGISAHHSLYSVIGRYSLYSLYPYKLGAIGYCSWQLFLAISALLCLISDTQDLVSKPRLLLSRPRALLQFSFFRGFLSASRSILEIGYPTLTQTYIDPPFVSLSSLRPPQFCRAIFLLFGLVDPVARAVGDRSYFILIF